MGIAFLFSIFPHKNCFIYIEFYIIVYDVQSLFKQWSNYVDNDSRTFAVVIKTLNIEVSTDNFSS